MGGYAEPLSAADIRAKLFRDRKPASDFLKAQPEKKENEPARMPALRRGPTFTLNDVRANQNVASKKEEQVGQKLEVDWDAVQRDRDGGMNRKKIADKYGVPEWQLYAKTKPVAGKKAAAKNGAATAPPITVNIENPNVISTDVVVPSTALLILKARRDALDDAIKVIEQLRETARAGK